jgi:hypothetical protein
MKTRINLFLSVFALCLVSLVNAQTVISTNFTNNNGSSMITFNFQNTNANDVIITDIASVTSITGANNATLWYKPTAINQTTMAVSTANGWTQVSSQAFTGVANTTTNVGQPMLTGLNLIIPAGSTYGLALSLTSGLRYSTLTAGSYTFTGGGCNLNTGTDVGFGGTLTSGINNRGFLGSVSFISGVACTGAPNAGITASTVNPVCPSVPFNLSMANATFSSGLTYQWQSASTATGPWSNIIGATSSSYLATQTVDSWYQCIVTCAASGLADTSAVLEVTTNTFVNCYCTSTATSAADEEILNVTLSTLNNSSTCGTAAPGPGSVASQYSNFTTSVSAPILSPGVVYPISIEIGTCGGNFNNWTKAWIDFNQNGLFTDPGEEVYSSLAATQGPHFENGLVSVPSGATQGLTRMRVVNVETTVTTGVNPCGTYTWGETEDYFVMISPPPTCPQPSAPVLVSANLNEAIIDWTPVGTETEWQVEYGPQGFTPGTGTVVTVTAHPYTVPNLTSYAFYQAYVRAICTPGDSSYWTPSVSWNTYDQGQYMEWNTECPTAGFIDISTSGTNANLLDDTELGITLPFPVLYQGSLFTSMTIGNNGGVVLGSTTAQVGYTMVNGNGLYPFIQDLGTSVVPDGVYYQQVGTSPNSKFVIQWENISHYAFPVLPDGATFELIIDEATQEIYYVYDDVIMGNPATWDYGQDAEIGVRGTQNINVSMNNQAYLQNNSCVHFYYVDCPNPVALTTSYLLPIEAAFTWTASAAGETSWTVVYGPAGFDPSTGGTTLNVSSASVQLMNLIPLGNYDMYIYSACSGGLSSNGLFFNFQTPPVCSNPTGFTSTAGLDSLMSSWSWSAYTSFYPSTGFNLQVVSQDSALYTGTVYALDNNFTDTTLNAAWYPGQSLDVYVQAVCGQDTSVYVGPISLVMPLSNDHACGAHEITVGAPGLLYNNTGATVANDELLIAPPVTGAQTSTGWSNNTLSHTTWFKFTAPASGNVRIDASGVNYDGQIAVYYGADCSILPSFTLEGANDNEIDGNSVAPNFTICGLIPGAVYHLMHDGQGTAGDYTIAISEVSVEAGVPGEVLNICYGESINLFLGIANYGLGGEWVATSPAVVLQGNNFNSTDYASQQYTFNYVVSDGCAIDQATATVIVHATPSAGDDGTFTVCLNEPFVLWNGLTGNVDANGTWFNSMNEVLSTAQDTSGTIPGSFNYDYIVESAYCANDSSNVLVIVDGSCDFTASIAENEMGVSMYPNPTSSLLYISKNQSGLASMELLDLNGKALHQQAMDQNLTLDLSSYPKGLYMVKIQMNGVSVIERIAVQ